MAGLSPEHPTWARRFQTGQITTNVIAEMPKECKGIYDRKQHMKVGIQMQKNRKRHFSITRLKWQYTDGNSANDFGVDGHAVSSSIYPANGLAKAYYYRCTLGKRKTNVIGRCKGAVINADTGETIGQRCGPKLSVAPIRVFGAEPKQKIIDGMC